MKWQMIAVDGLGPVSRIAAVFQVGPPVKLAPFPSFKVKIIERDNATFLATANVALKDESGQPIGEAGLGNTVEEALQDCLERFAAALRSRIELSEFDFEWSDPQEF